jgi:hypothetical protein
VRGVRPSGFLRVLLVFLTNSIRYGFLEFHRGLP